MLQRVASCPQLFSSIGILAFREKKRNTELVLSPYSPFFEILGRAEDSTCSVSKAVFLKARPVASRGAFRDAWVGDCMTLTPTVLWACGFSNRMGHRKDRHSLPRSSVGMCGIRAIIPSAFRLGSQGGGER